MIAYRWLDLATKFKCGRTDFWPKSLHLVTTPQLTTGDSVSFAKRTQAWPSWVITNTCRTSAYFFVCSCQGCVIHNFRKTYFIDCSIPSLHWLLSPLNQPVGGRKSSTRTALGVWILVSFCFLVPLLPFSHWNWHFKSPVFLNCSCLLWLHLVNATCNLLSCIHAGHTQPSPALPVLHQTHLMEICTFPSFLCFFVFFLLSHRKLPLCSSLRGLGQGWNSGGGFGFKWFVWIAQTSCVGLSPYATNQVKWGWPKPCFFFFAACKGNGFWGFTWPW